MYLIGIDIGTTNTKAVAFTDGGETLASAATSYPVISDHPGWHELDPDRLFEAVLEVLKEVLARAGADAGRTAVDTHGKGSGPEGPDGPDGPDGGKSSGQGGGLGPAGVSFSCAMHSLILVDAQGIPLTRALIWADLRSEKYASDLRSGEAGRPIYRNTGTPIHPMSPLCKILWFKGEKPELFRKAARFISIKEYIWWRLFGKYQVDHSIASCTGLFDIRAFDWYVPSLTLAGISRQQLSMPVPCTHAESERVAPYLDLFGLPGNLPFIIGATDGCLANLGTRAMEPGETALTIGTSGAVRMMARGPAEDPAERIFNYILTDKHYVCGGATNNGGNAVQWYLNCLEGGLPHADKGRSGDVKVEATEEETERRVREAFTAEPGCEGLIFLPFLLGERAPFWNADARAVFFGMRQLHDRRHFLRAVLEGVSHTLYQVGLSLKETVGPIRDIYASGGFTRSPEWVQLIADIFGCRVHLMGGADASATGAAMMGYYALGILPNLEAAGRLVRVRETFEPNEKRHRLYQERSGVFLELYSRLKDLMGPGL